MPTPAESDRKLLSSPIFFFQSPRLSYRNYVTNLFGNCHRADNWPKRTTQRNDDWFQLATPTAFCDSDKLNCWDARQQWIRPIEASNWFAPAMTIDHLFARPRREVSSGDDVNICSAVSDDTAADAGRSTVDCLQISWCRWFIYSARANKNDFCRGKTLNCWCWLTDNRFFFSGHGANPLKWFICSLAFLQTMSRRELRVCLRFDENLFCRASLNSRLMFRAIKHPFMEV